MENNLRIAYKNFHLGFRYDETKINKNKFRTSSYTHYGIWKGLLNYLKQCGFKIKVPDNIKKHHKCLTPSHRYGYIESSGYKLEFKTSIFPVGFELDFFQNHNIINKNGGQYDFDKHQLMPYLCKKMCELYIKKISNFLQKNYNTTTNIIDKRKLTSYEKIVLHFQTSSFTRNKITSLNEVSSFMSNYDNDCNSLDKNKNKLVCGEVKYTYGYNGRLIKGTVYHNINNMWWLIPNASEYYNKASFELFDITPEILKVRRNKRYRIPESYKKKTESLKKLSLKDLECEIKRRKKSV